MSATTIALVVVLFTATFIRSAFGFGEALFAVPLLALMVPVQVAAPVAVLVSITVAAVVVLQDWSHIHLRSAGALLAATVFGAPVGLLLLKTVSEHVLKGVLALVIVAFSMYSLMAPRAVALVDDRLAWIFGLLAGVLGGAYGMNGPPLVVFGTLRGWSPQRFRATLQAYFLPASLIVLAGYWATGLWTPPVTRLYTIALPGVAAAIVLGRAVNRRLDQRTFLALVHGALIAVGVLLLAQAVRRTTEEGLTPPPTGSAAAPRLR